MVTTSPATLVTAGRCVGSLGLPIIESGVVKLLPLLVWVTAAGLLLLLPVLALSAAGLLMLELYWYWRKSPAAT